LGANLAGHVYCIEERVADGLVPSKAITASSMHLASIKMQNMKNYRVQPTKGIDLFVARRSTSILGPTEVE
jgi:hypothetical protein